ncbi:C40 family peptidase [Pelagibacterium sp. 26DY04]|uniref:C40 family peptidase n=1 Tax=Pelagibacterium sp. 26DY04 TaxID=2967130 RepID=UPI0028169A37|nr:NlpC/P60 family protein [Pelagibacterium sp. 26DY04]WMT85558.1 C40 family peptidase [Pelagibacterium sp. 26DY04]
MHWSEKFLGLPYEPLGRSVAGADCYGVCWLVLTSFGVPAPSYAGEYASSEEVEEVSAFIGRTKGQWVSVERPKELDLVTFRRGGWESHVGIVVKPGLMLHSSRGKPSCIEDYTSGIWANRLTGFWRHRALA